MRQSGRRDDAQNGKQVLLPKTVSVTDMLELERSKGYLPKLTAANFIGAFLFVLFIGGSALRIFSGAGNANDSSDSNYSGGMTTGDSMGSTTCSLRDDLRGLPDSLGQYSSSKDRQKTLYVRPGGESLWSRMSEAGHLVALAHRMSVNLVIVAPEDAAPAYRAFQKPRLPLGCFPSGVLSPEESTCTVRKASSMSSVHALASKDGNWETVWNRNRVETALCVKIEQHLFHSEEDLQWFYRLLLPTNRYAHHLASGNMMPMNQSLRDTYHHFDFCRALSYLTDIRKYPHKIEESENEDDSDIWLGLDTRELSTSLQQSLKCMLTLSCSKPVPSSLVPLDEGLKRYDPMFKEKQRVFVYLSREYNASISTIPSKQLGMDSSHVVILDPQISGLDQYEWDALNIYLIRCVIGLVDYLHHDYIH